MVSIVTREWVGRPRNCAQICGCGNRFTSSSKHPNWFGNRPASYETGVGVLSPEFKCPRREVELSLPSISKIKKAWSSTFTPSYTYMVCSFIIRKLPFTYSEKQRDDSFLTKRNVDLLKLLFAIYRNVIFNRFIQFLTFVGKENSAQYSK